MPPGSENEEPAQEDQVVLDPMDVHIIVVDKVVVLIEEGKINELNAPISLEQSPLTNHQVKVTDYVFEDSFVDLLEPLKEEVFHHMANLSQHLWKFVVFTDVGFQNQLSFDLPLSFFLCLLKATVSKTQSSSHLID